MVLPTYTGYPATACLTALVLLAGCSDGPGDRSDQARELQAPVRPASVAAPIPDFASIADVGEKKAEFFDYLQPKIQIVNDHIWAERQFILRFQEKLKTALPAENETKAFRQIAERYSIPATDEPDDDYFAELLTRVDVVPASLVLAQAANESAWGTSRFARQGKNFFGIWCYSGGCGLKPRARSQGARHEVRQFGTVQDGVFYYAHNINTGSAYSGLRQLRAQRRLRDEQLSGAHLAQGLTRYSERGADYVDEIRRMIRQNDLSKYNIQRGFEDRDRSAAR